MKRILVIDDDKDLTDTIKFVLEHEGYKVMSSHEGEDGIIKAKEQKPDLILLDIMMPGMDGTKAISLLKEEPVTSNIPVVFLTGLVSEQDEGRTSKINVGDIEIMTVAKPFDNEKLLETVKTILE